MSVFLTEKCKSLSLKIMREEEGDVTICKTQRSVRVRNQTFVQDNYLLGLQTAQTYIYYLQLFLNGCNPLLLDL